MNNAMITITEWMNILLINCKTNAKYKTSEFNENSQPAAKKD